jgi:conserved domain protein
MWEHIERSVAKMTLNEVPVGEVCTVVKLNGTGALKRRIMDMGITKGTEIQVVKIAPLGDPMELNLRGYDLSVRKNEAASIEVVR